MPAMLSPSYNTAHELLVGVIDGFIVLAIANSFRWLTNWTQAFDKKQAAKELQIMETLGPRYAGRMLKKMRQALISALYCLCCAIFMYMAEFSGMRPLECLLVLVAAVLSFKALSDAGATTVEGSEDRIRHLRKRLGLIENGQRNNEVPAVFKG